ncbi:DUF4132 domain-containing protein [Paenarthrobacter nitroguajacolicus]|uniref:DUF4132 domain-containing protein n=1 Tax=Paenarthrobacter nitroguajacolicus TaxID=211146 RepID=UPI003AE90770
MSTSAELEGRTAMPDNLRVLADEQSGRLLEFFMTPHSDWPGGGEGLEKYRERFARYLGQLDPDGQKGAFAFTFAHIHEHRYGIADRYYEPFGIPAGRVHMLPPIEQALYIFSELAPLDWRAQELDWMLTHVPYSRYIYPSWRGAFHAPILALEPAERCTIPAATRRLEAVLLTDFRDGPGLHPKIREFDELLLSDSEEDGRIPLQYVAEDDDFGPSIRNAVRPVMPEHHVARLLLFMSELNGPKPTAKWKRAADLRIAEQPAVLGVAQALLGLAAERRPTADLGEISCLTLHVGSVLRAALWLLALQPDAPANVQLIRDGSAYLGAGHNGKNGVCRSAIGANAGVEALLEIAKSHETATTDVVGALTHIRDVVKNKNLHKRLVNVIDQLSAERGISPSELLETAVPDLGLDADGGKTFEIDEYTARVTLTSGQGTAAAKLEWFTTAGEAVPMPTQLKNHPKLPTVKLATSEAKKALNVQRRRLERLMASERLWPGHDFRTRYLEHPVVGTIARDLLWTITIKEGEYSGYPRRIGGASGWELVGLHGETYAIPGDASVVLWKPWARSVGEVRSWRSHQLQHRLRQPFKQVYRELYLLTPAELETGHYSNRYAAHVLDYDRAQAIAKERGWHGAQLGPWDGGQDTQLYVEFPDEQLRAAFNIELLELETERANLCSTNRVWFERRAARDTWESIALDAVPPAVFSEAMRDVDLFTSVAVIGPDPDWADHPNGLVRDYWGGTHTGELSESAQTRHEYLSEVLPRTILFECCQMTDRHLIVRGTHRTYKIHLGSGNILMEPDDSYLCIVQAPRSSSERIFLPFEERLGDWERFCPRHSC